MKSGPLNCTWTADLGARNPERLKSHALRRRRAAGSGRAGGDLQTAPTADWAGNGLNPGNPFRKLQSIATAPPKHTNCASVAGAKAARSCTSVKEVLGMPGRVSDVPSRCLISVTAKTHRWRQNQLAVFNCERTLTAELWGQRFGCYVQPFHVSGKKASSTMC